MGKKDTQGHSCENEESPTTSLRRSLSSGTFIKQQFDPGDRRADRDFALLEYATEVKCGGIVGVTETYR